MYITQELTLQCLLEQVHEGELDVVLGVDVGRELLGEGVARPQNVLLRRKPAVCEQNKSI